MQPVEQCAFTNPLALYTAAGRAFGNTRVLLQASSQDGAHGRYSYLGCDPAEIITRYDAQHLARILTPSADYAAVNAWFGYIGYENVRHTEPSIAIPKKHGLRFPDICLIRFHRVYVMDHHTGIRTLYTRLHTPAVPLREAACPAPDAAMPAIISSQSHMPDARYVRHVRAILEHIRAGDIFQANITRKFSFTYKNNLDAAAVFARLTRASPSALSALVSAPFGTIASSSPEMFITISPDGVIRAAPIKGSAARSRDIEEDARIVAALSASEKDRAENIMIADLYRNDMARSCVPGSVITEKLCRSESFRTVHHLVSDIRGQLRPEVTPFEAIMRAFPPGSMTGAPKPMAMALCARYEQMQRGVYSGVLGMFGGDGSANLSVVIRTILLQGKYAETQSGGGIVADSIPEKELIETRFKLRGVLAALNAPMP